MEIEIGRPTSATATGDLREHARRRVRFALRYAAWRVSRAIVHLADADNRRSAVNKRCEIRVMLIHGLGDAVVVADAAADPYVAIDRAAARAAREVARCVARQSR